MMLNSSKIEDMNEVDRYGGTPLHDAAASGHDAVCQILMEHKRSKEQLYIKNKLGLRPVNVAKGKAKSFLRKHEADVDLDKMAGA